MTEESKLPQRVVILTHEFFPTHGGIATYVRELAGALVELGVEVTVWAPDSPTGQLSDSAGERFDFGIRPLRLRGTQSWDCRLKLAWALLSERDSWHDAVLYLPEPGPIRTWCYLQLIPGLLPSRLVITLHGSEIENLSRWPHRRSLFHRLLRNADRVGVVSKNVKRALLSRYPDIEAKSVLAYGAVRKDIPGSSESGPPFNHRTDAGHGKWILLTVGRIHPRKGQLAVVEALGLLSQPVRERILYRIVGPVGRHAYHAEIAATAAAAGVAVEFAGPLSESELKNAFAQAHAFVMASVRSKFSVEGFGLVYLEAGARGLPVVAHDTGGVADAVKNGVTGILVPPDDRQALSDAILQLLESPALRRSMGEAGRLHAQEFSWTRTARQLFSGL